MGRERKGERKGKERKGKGGTEGEDWEGGREGPVKSVKSRARKVSSLPVVLVVYFNSISIFNPSSSWIQNLHQNSNESGN